MLILPIKKKWYDMILSGEKKEEYREIKPYYEIRLQNFFGAIAVESLSGYKLLQGDSVPEEIRREPVQQILFRNGYSKESPSFIAKCTLSVGEGRPEWGAEPEKEYFILSIIEIVNDEHGSSQEVNNG